MFGHQNARLRGDGGRWGKARGAGRNPIFGGYSLARCLELRQPLALLIPNGDLFGNGDPIRTGDLQGMNLMSYRAAPPRVTTHPFYPTTGRE